MTIDRRIFRQADFIEVAVDNVIDGAARRRPARRRRSSLLFLANFRAAAITLTAMPLSLAAAVLVLRAFGATHQHDDARRHGHRHRRAGRRCDHRRGERGAAAAGERARSPQTEQRPAADVVRDATLEIRTSIVFATIIIVLVFLPIFGLSGVEGRLLTPLAFAYIVALLASLAVAIVVTPALCFAFLPGARVDRSGATTAGWRAR